MEALVLDRDFHAQAVIDAFESFIWTVRYIGCGEFELYVPTLIQPLEYVKLDYYLYNRDSDRVMIIEEVLNETDPETGAHMTLSGRSLESILERRVVWNPTVFDGTAVNVAIRQLIYDNFITCNGNNQRKIPNFVYKENPDLSNAVTDPQNGISAFYWGENVYDVIVNICKAYDLGFKVILNNKNQFQFELYEGVDHSYDQDENPHVVFSYKYENLFGSQYLKSRKDFKNSAIVIGSDADDRDTEWQEADYDVRYTGLDRRETYVNGSSIQYPKGEVSEADADYWRRYYDRKVGDGDGQITQERADELYEAKIEELIEEDLWTNKMPIYYNQLIDEGWRALADTLPIEAFDGQVDASQQYVYKQDFDLGDIVQVSNEFGMEATVRITEIVHSQDISGLSVTPTFTNTLDEY